MPEIDPGELLEKVFKKMGAKPETLIIPNILLKKDTDLDGLIVIPGHFGIFSSCRRSKRSSKTRPGYLQSKCYSN